MRRPPRATHYAKPPRAGPLSRARAAATAPPPIPHLRHIHPFADDISPVLDQLVLHFLLDVGTLLPKFRQAVDHIHYQVESVHLIQHRHIEWGRDSPFLFISPHMDVGMVLPSVGEPVYQPW